MEIMTAIGMLYISDGVKWINHCNDLLQRNRE
jgi:hypothetical protein